MGSRRRPVAANLLVPFTTTSAPVREGAAALTPTNVSFEEAASLPLVALTAWQALVEIGRLGANQRVLISHRKI